MTRGEISKLKLSYHEQATLNQIVQERNAIDDVVDEIHLPTLVLSPEQHRLLSKASNSSNLVSRLRPAQLSILSAVLRGTTPVPKLSEEAVELLNALIDQVEDIEEAEDPLLDLTSDGNLTERQRELLRGASEDSLGAAVGLRERDLLARLLVDGKLALLDATTRSLFNSMMHAQQRILWSRPSPHTVYHSRSGQGLALVQQHMLVQASKTPEIWETVPSSTQALVTAIIAKAKEVSSLSPSEAAAVNQLLVRVKREERSLTLISPSATELTTEQRKLLTEVIPTLDSTSAMASLFQRVLDGSAKLADISGTEKQMLNDQLQHRRTMHGVSRSWDANSDGKVDDQELVAMVMDVGVPPSTEAGQLLAQFKEKTSALVDEVADDIEAKMGKDKAANFKTSMKSKGRQSAKASDLLQFLADGKDFVPLLASRFRQSTHVLTVCPSCPSPVCPASSASPRPPVCDCIPSSFYLSLSIWPRSHDQHHSTRHRIVAQQGTRQLPKSWTCTSWLRRREKRTGWAWPWPSLAPSPNG